MSRPAPVSRRDPDPAGPGARAEPTTPSTADRVALGAVWAGPVLTTVLLLAVPSFLTYLLVGAWPVLLLVAWAGWAVHTLVLRSRSWVRGALGRVPRTDRLLAWGWAAAWVVPALAATFLPEDAIQVTVALLLLAVGVVPALTILSVGRHARARRTVLRL